MVFHLVFFFYNLCPNAPCMEYLPTFPLECGHFSPNVGKYSLHGASGMGFSNFGPNFRKLARLHQDD